LAGINLEANLETEKKEECPECKTGAPAWMATFADMATLLMAFFVLILSFAHMNVPKFKDVSGSMSEAFGLQREIPVVEPPRAQSMIATQFMQSKVDPTQADAVQEQTTDDPQPEDPILKISTQSQDGSMSEDVAAMKSVLAKEIAEGQVEVEAVNGRINVTVVSQTGQENSESDAGDASGHILSQEEIELYAKVVAAQLTISSQVDLFDKEGGESAEAEVSGAKNDRTEKAAQDEERRLKAELSEQMAEGLLNVERIGSSVKLTLADKGAFVSGSAQLSSDFAELLRGVGDSLQGSRGEITVAGHTDDVPIAFSRRFQSNWDLSAARSSSVADYLLENGYVDSGKVTVTGFADTIPVAPNDTPDGRSRNRRIEIMIDSVEG
jgi:chemotaxis protein MotB